MKLISWNVNGLRACLGKGFLDFFTTADADIFAIQETKLQEGQVELELPGYHIFWNSAQRKGYSGTAVFTKAAPLSVTREMGIEVHDQEGRILALEYEDFYFVNVYTPNSQRELTRLDYRMTWEEDFREFLLGMAAKKPVVVCGDLNVAHREIDLFHPKTNTKNAGFTPQEREKMTLLQDAGFVDSYRHLYPDQTGAYTWWSYIRDARSKNVGWRIDYFLVSEAWRGRINEAVIYADVTGSDHCPIGLTLC